MKRIFAAFAAVVLFLMGLGGIRNESRATMLRKDYATTRLKISPPSAAGQSEGLSDADLLKALTTPLTAQIEAQNQRLSAWLQAHPLDAQAHEQAA